MGKVDLDPLPFKAMKASVCLKRQLPFYVGAFESTCDKRSAHAVVLLSFWGGSWPAAAHSPFFPRRSLPWLSCPCPKGCFSLLLPYQMQQRPWWPWGGLAAPRGVLGHSRESELLQLFLLPGQSSQETQAGLPDSGADQQWHLWLSFIFSLSARKAAFC